MENDSTAATSHPLPPSSNHRSHMKRPSSSFCIPQPYPSYPDSSSTSASSPADGIDNNDDDDDEQLRLQPMLKRRSILRQQLPWTNSEQESLYIAVERLNLFGRWGEVKTRMNLDRTTSEIEEEYNRLYAEIPDSEDEDDGDEDEDEDEEGEDEEEDEGMYSGEVLMDNNNDSAQDTIGATSATSLSTPSLTATSSAAQSKHSSRENLAGLFGLAKAAATTATAATQQQQQPQTNEALMDQRCTLPPLLPLDPEDEYDEGYEDYEDHHQQQRQQPQHQDQQSNCPPYHHLYQTQQQQHSPQHSHQRNLSTSSTSRPARMVRVWTPEQSENLKNLVEVYFPGAYRINWVWVAAQMGNAFTRKQCKNKWEIMRRRMGTEDEIVLLKRGFQEFGPSWGQIQEKYLPERSRGGISIMWELLETREAELYQQQQQPQAGGVVPGSGVVGGGGGGVVVPGMTMAGPGSATRKPLSHHRRNSSLSSVKSSLRVNVSKDSANGATNTTSQRHQRTLTLDIDAMDLSSPTTALYTLTEEMTIGSNNNSTRPYAPSSTTMTTTAAPHRHRKSASVSSTTSMSRYGHGRHASDVSLGGHEWSTERMMPMTWTEPLTRRLQDLVREHFPNQSKVNWAMISSLMGNNPVVSKDQCKRRWYLISQQQQQQQQQQIQQQHHGSIHGQLEYRDRQHLDPSEAMLA
ncbi:hypothetical protein BGX24_010252 [Mortierella sp. AD032]|nr:hypothetical protein BGX24_010252 [Mortierella sp. AD032]